jgi:hypothetical protein
MYAELQDADYERRLELRSFLMRMRSNVQPENVGLPHLGHRRVPGLRRQEVAELVGVSEDWYRWFESGRNISVSPRFLARVADALQLGPTDEVALYRLALPELYRADRLACTLHCLAPKIA